MPFNSDNYTQPPFTNGIMTLTNDECVKVKNKCQEIKDAYVYDSNYPSPTMLYVVSTYNESNNYQEAINGDTYEVLERYNPEVNTQGISPEYSDGIVPEPEPEPTPEEPEEGEGEETAPEPTPEPEQQPETEEEEEIQGA
jgi:hypothetical protein